MFQLLGFLSVALYASLQELEFGQRALGYEMSDTSKEVALCGCKQSKNAPYCDGTHLTL